MTLTPTQQASVDRIRLWRADPAQMVRDLWRVEPDAWQIEGLRAFADRDDPQKRRISMQACAGPGKSCEESWMGWNFLICYADKDKHPNGAAISITAENLKNGLWKELAVWYNRSPVLQQAFEMTSERIFAREHPQTWYLGARSYSKTADPDSQGRTLSGLHAPFMLYLLDESGDMHPAVMRSAEQGLSNCEWGKIVQAGNTTSQQGCLYQAATTQRHLWYVIEITADPESADRTPRVSIDWAREQIALYGRDNPWVMAFILGKFPPGGINQLLSLEDVSEAMKRSPKPDQFDWAQKRIGIDVARFGDDRTVIFPRQGIVALQPSVMRHQDTTAIAARAMMQKNEWAWEMALIDDTGHWGHGVIDNLRASKLPVVGIQFHDRKTNNPRYFNRRTEMWLEMAEWIKRGGALPNLPELVPELTTPTYGFREGKMLLEEKDSIKIKIGRSPDLADALALTFALPDMPNNPRLPHGFQVGGMVTDTWFEEDRRPAASGMASERWFS